MWVLHDPAMALLGFGPEKGKSYSHRGFCVFIAALPVVAPGGNQCQGPSTADRVNRLCGVHAVEYYEAMKRDRLCICSTTGVHLPGSVPTAKPIGHSSKAAPEAKELLGIYSLLLARARWNLVVTESPQANRCPCWRLQISPADVRTYALRRWGKYRESLLQEVQ